MKMFLVLLLCLGLVGCTAVSRMTRLNNRGENTITVDVKGTVAEAKNLIKAISSELKLIERPAAETENFMLVSTNKLKQGIIHVVSGGFGTAAYYTQLGFFFDYNEENNTTKVTISEEVSAFGDPRRYIYVDKIKLKQLESADRH
jgi:hypothetical protein